MELQEMAVLSGRSSKEYPYYVELGSGKKKEIQQNNEEEKEEYIVPAFPNNGFPPFWLLPILIVGVIGLLAIPKILLKKANYK